MSRAPANEPPVSALNSAMSPFGVIDFIDNQCMQGIGASAIQGGGALSSGMFTGLSSAPQGVSPGVVGGPPAYLEAHGIRYVPSSSLESPADPAYCVSEPSSVSMARRAVEMPVASSRELKTRVDRNVTKFLASDHSGDDEVGHRDRLRSHVGKNYEEEDVRPRSYKENNEEENLRGQLKAIERQIEELERQHESKISAQARLSALKANLKSASESGNFERLKKIEKLRSECVEAAQKTKSSQPSRGRLASQANAEDSYY